MLKKILNLEGVQVLSKAAQVQTKGGSGCTSGYYCVGNFPLEATCNPTFEHLCQHIPDGQIPGIDDYAFYCTC